jgi:hypothetical protein
MHNVDLTEDVLPIASMRSVCPFCRGRGLLTRAAGSNRYGVLCCGCQARFPETFKTWDEAVAAWSSRRGTVASFGGRATAGKCSRRKLRASKRNLRKARERKQLKRIRAKLEELMPLLRAAREAEMADFQKQIAKDRAWVRSMEPVFRQHPALNQMLELLKGYWERRPSSAGP